MILALWLLLWQAPDPVAQAVKALEADKPQDVLVLLKPVVEKDPANLVAWFHLGLAQALLGQDEEAVASYRRVLDEKPDLYEARINMAQVLTRLKRPAEAKPLLEAAIEQKPKEPAPLLLLGVCLIDMKDYTGAESRLRAALDLDGKNADAWSLLGRALHAQGKLDEAAAAFEKSGEKQAGSAVREQEATQLLSAGKAAEAAVLLEKVVAEAPTPAVKYALAVAYLRLKQPEKSLALAADVVQAEPRNYEVRMFYGRLLRDQKDYPRAAPQFLEAVKLKPGEADAWSELTGMLILLKQYPQALQGLEKLRSLQGETAAYWWFRATVLDALKQPKEAIPCYEKFLELSQGKSLDEEFKARQRLKTLKNMVRK
jgi:tetratricopeptide (TPR) repeat protein